MISTIGLLFGVFICTVVLTGTMRIYSIKRNLVDIPNNRSSHSTHVPRGGGISIVFVFLVGMVFLWEMSFIELGELIAFFGAGLAVAIIGFIDDHGHIKARWRLLAHFTSASWVIYWFGGLPSLFFFGTELDLSWFGDILAIVALVWLLNLYNFMDGIDGLAGIEALFSSLTAGILIVLVTGQHEIAMPHIIMSVSAAGFLVWNLPSAKIFMGDVGSGFIGMMLGGLILYSSHIAAQMLWVWLILLGVFVVDSTYTLSRRFFRGDKVYEAHRSHAYQYASRKYKGHFPVVLSVSLINLVWLLPWSFAVAYNVIDGFIAILISYSPLVWMAWYYHAGELDYDTQD